MNDRSSVFAAINFVWPGIIVAAVGLYGYLTYRPALTSARPAPTADTEYPRDTSREVTSAYSRLWQDPLGKEYANLQSDGDKRADLTKKPLTPSAFLSDDSLQYRYLVLPVFVPGGPTIDDCEQRQRTRYAVVAGLTTLGFRPESNSRLRFFALQLSDTADTPRGQEPTSERDKVPAPPSDTDNQPAEVSTGRQPTCQPVPRTIIIPYETYVAGATDSPYVSNREEPVNPETSVPANPPVDNGRAGGAKSSIPRPSWTAADGKRYLDGFLFKSVLILWLDEDRTGKTHLRTVTQLVTRLQDLFSQSHTSNMTVRMIGPTSTNVLLNMASESAAYGAHDSSQCPHKCTETHGWMYSPRSTISVDYLRRDNKEDGRLQVEGAHNRLRDFLEIEPQKPFGINVIRTIGTDEQLADTLVRELKLRRAWPQPGKLGECVVLITERDTIYGSALPYVFRVLMEDDIYRDNIAQQSERLTDADIRDIRSQQLLVYTYTRGIDGILPGDKPGASNDASPQGADARTSLSTTRQNVPSGRAQLDYLERLENKLVEISETRRRAGGRGIIAVGVTGSDVYDKMIVLRSLRRRFPNTWFFTTDLDEEFFRVSEAEHTRHLLIASHFGLSLHPSLQRDVPPFRDSYQTACYFSMLLALGDERFYKIFGPDFVESELWNYGMRSQSATHYEPGTHLLSLVFELGRDGPYQLTRSGGEYATIPGPDPSERNSRETVSARIHETSPSERGVFFRASWRHWCYACMATLALVAVLAFNLTALRNTCLAILDAVWKGPRWCVCFVHWLFARTCGLLRKNVLRSGWRRAARRAAAILGGGTLFAWRYCREHHPLTPWNLVVWATGLLLAILLVLIAHSHLSPDEEPFTFVSGISVWPSALIRFAAAVAAAVFICKGLADLRSHPEGLYVTAMETCRTKTARSTRHRKHLTWRARRSAAYEAFLWRPTRPPRLPARQQTVTVAALVCLHARRGRVLSRVIRFVAMSACFLAFGYCLFRIVGFPNHPYRGGRERWVSQFVLLSSVVALVCLTFFVVDAIQLCRRFLSSLSKESRGWLKAPMDDALHKWKRPERDDLRELLKIEVIANYTNVVSKMLIYPFSILLLLIIARHPAFDYWDIPVALVVLMLLLFFIPLAQGLLMRRDAHKARELSLANLRRAMATVPAANEQNRKDVIAQLIAEIERTQRGAFRMITDDYVFRALAIPFGGTGGLLLLEQLLQ